MFSKVASKVSQFQQLTSLSTRAFRASAVANSKKPSIGDAVTILQSKVSGINQVVSAARPPARNRQPKIDTRPFLVRRALQPLTRVPVCSRTT